MSAVGNYISESDVSNWADGATEAQKQAIIDRVEQIVERATKDIFYPKRFGVKIDGNGKNRLFMPFRQRLLHVDEIKVLDIELDASWYRHDERSVFIDLESTAGALAEKRWLLRQTEGTVIFPSGYDNVKIRGTLGWPELLDMDNVSGVFEEYETITGGTSGATAVVSEVDDNFLIIEGRSATNFSNDETITGEDSEATASVNSASGAVNNPPEAIVEACIILASYENDSTLYTRYMPEGEEELGSHRYQNKKKLLTGVFEADILVEHYILKNPVLAVA